MNGCQEFQQCLFVQNANPLIGIKKERKFQRKNNIFYVYVFLDVRSPGKWKYDRYEFDYKPFYIGKGKGERCSKVSDRNRWLEGRLRKRQHITIKVQEKLTETEAFSLEKKLISIIGRGDLNRGPLLNFTNGGEGDSGHKHSRETKERLRKLGKERKHSEETKRKISIIVSNRIRREPTEETKKKWASNFGSGMSGRCHSKETKEKMSIAASNRTEEYNKKISKSKKGHVVTEETKIKISETLKRKWKEGKYKKGAT